MTIAKKMAMATHMTLATDVAMATEKAKARDNDIGSNIRLCKKQVATKMEMEMTNSDGY